MCRHIHEYEYKPPPWMLRSALTGELDFLKGLQFEKLLAPLLVDQSCHSFPWLGLTGVNSRLLSR